MPGLVDETKCKLKELMNKKESIESDIKELSEVLETQQNVGMDGPLVNEERYPRSDIDVYSVRHARHQIICLQNDLKAVMKEIEENLHKLHAEAREKTVDSGEEQRMEIGASSQDLNAFARVDRVDEGSPASQSGLRVDDKLLEFGSVNSTNFQSLQNVATVVQHGKGRPLNVTVIRNTEVVHLALTPNTWTGRGLLGCNIVPITR
ncbi:26S proteasome non-ATPase regulatory subunit 9-like [Tubulanus polymorphus]|uniref:26S proteasome non-ATPase regulatory subunit 9-like n=1 Tax=Tubulanus polymorphus TaxID=672921 RepID=UPI003DA501CF